MRGTLQIEIDNLTEEQAKKYLQELVDFLDEQMMMNILLGQKVGDIDFGDNGIS